MKLKELRLENFQGIKNLEINTDCKDIRILGDNGTGKTTIANAICWLLYGKPSTNEKGYTPKTKDANGEDVHFTNHIAEGTFVLEDGSQITLKKDYYENYQKVRGSNQETFKGNTLDYYVDGVPVKEKEYTARLESICTAEQAKMLTIPDYFAEQMPWQKRREILLEICGDITDHEVIDSNEQLHPLRDYLRKIGTTDKYYTVEEYAAIAKSQKAEINKKLGTIPARIDEARKAMPENILDIDTIATISANIEIDKQKAEAELNTMTDASANSELRAKIAELEAEIAEERTKHYRKTAEATREYDDRIAELENQMHAESGELPKLARRKAEVEEQKVDMTKRRDKLIEEYKMVQEQTFEYESKCPTCGQEIPAEQIENARAVFNLTKSERLEQINQEGAKYSKEKIKALEGEIATIEEKEKEVTDKVQSIKQAIEEARKSRPQQPSFEESIEYRSRKAEIAILTEKMQAEGKTSTEAKEAIKSKIKGFQDELDKMNEHKSMHRMAQVQQKRIESLQQEEKELAEEYEKIEYGVWLAEEFTRAKASMLDEKINSKFDSVRFKLFTTQVNGGQADACEAMVVTTEGLKPYSKANTGARINGGIEIADVLGRHWGVTMPIIIDNCESVTKVQPTKAQQIKMYVKEGQNSIKIEIDRDITAVRTA